MPTCVLCDFDGTIALEDVTDALLEQFATPTWLEIEAEWKTGRIGSRECMRRQVDLLRATPADIDRRLDAIAIDPGFPGFVAEVQRLGVSLMVVSDGLDYAIRRILGRFGLDHLPIIANRLESLGADRHRLSFPYASETCLKGSGVCKCAVGETRSPPGATRLLIGDGASDFCAASSVDFVFAKDKLLDHCRAESLPHAAFADFDEATRLLRSFLRQRAASAPLSLELETE